MKTTIIILVTSFFAICSYAHSGKPDHYILIDTDGASDDFRAISMFLASSRFEVLGITTSAGTLDSRSVKQKVKALLNTYYHQGIPVVAGSEEIEFTPDWRDFCLSIEWGDTTNFPDISDKTSEDFISETINTEENKITIVCMGSLINLYNALKDKSINKNNIKKIIWYNSNDIESGINYKFHKEAAVAILNSDLPIEIITSDKDDLSVYSDDILKEISLIHSYYATQFENVMIQCKNKNPDHAGCLKVADELLFLYLIVPEAFKNIQTKEKENIKVFQLNDINLFKVTLFSILDIERMDESKIFKGFPLDHMYYKEDVAENMNEIIEKFGMSEWRAGVLTNELHGHLGVYAIIGVKMGLRFREYLNIGIDNIKVYSFAGGKPPLSCMNDGLQVITGATVGHGLFNFSESNQMLPQAEFEYKGRIITLKLKDEYCTRINMDIKECIVKYGNLTPAYWNNLREIALKYWEELDRHSIFEINDGSFKLI